MDDTLSLRIPPDLKADLVRLAEAEERKVSDLVRLLLRRAVRAQQAARQAA